MYKLGEKKVSGTVLLFTVSALRRPLGQKESRNVARAAFEGNHATPSDTSRIGRMVKRRHCRVAFTGSSTSSLRIWPHSSIVSTARLGGERDTCPSSLEA